MKKILLLLIVSLGLRSISASAQVSGPSVAVSTTSVRGVAGGAASYAPVFSADGRFLVFTGSANNLVTNDNNSLWLDVFVRDLLNNSTTLVSLDSSGVGGGNGNSYNPTISSNGQFIAFESAASNLAGNDTNGASDIFVRDMASNVTSLVSVNANGTASGTGNSIYAGQSNNGGSRNPIINPDGRFVAFESSAVDLVAGDTNGLNDIFVRDIQAGVTLWASTGITNKGTKLNFSISADGQRVVFSREPLAGVPISGALYFRDFTNSDAIPISTNINNQATFVNSYNPEISADGQFVAFKAALTTAGKTKINLYYYDLQNSVTTLIATNVLEEAFPEMTPNGRFVAYESGTNVFLWDSTTGSNLLVSVDLFGTNAANGSSFRPIVCADGSKIAFLSDASNLTTNVGNGQPQLYIRDLLAGTTRLVSVNLNGQPGSSVSGVVSAISSDGSLVAFWSLDGNFVPDDQNRDADVFIRNLTTETTSLVSAHHFSLPALTSVGSFVLGPNSVSADGRFAIISGLGSTLVNGETTPFSHVFLHDIATGANLAVNSLENTNGTPVSPDNIPFPTNQMARFPVLSANGRYAAYVAKNFSDTPGINQQVYVRDLQSATNWLVTRPWNGFGVSTLNSSSPSISGDGFLVAFQSNSGNLVPTDANGISDVFVRDVQNATNRLVSVNLGGGSGNNISTNPVISKDGRWVLFQSKATDLASNSGSGSTYQLFARDLLSNSTTILSQSNNLAFTGESGGPTISPDSTMLVYTNTNKVYFRALLATTNQLVCTNCFNPSLSADGRWVAFESGVGTNKNIVLKDIQSGTTNLISISTDGVSGGNRASTKPIISFDGRYIVFASRATNLVANDTNGMTDIFVRDRILNVTVLASVNRLGTGPANGMSSQPVLGADGRSVIFQSFASDLIEKDFNNNRDIFVLRLNSGDSDGDGLDDDWELAYFGNLTRNGSGDFDGDGHTDAQEFALGTDPTNLGSVLRVMTISSLGGNTTVLWSATPGKKYQLQFKTGITDVEWTDLGDIVIANGSTAMKLDNSGAFENRFYRVLFVP